MSSSEFTTRPTRPAGLAGLDPELAKRALDATRDGVLIADAAKRGFPIVWASPSFAAITGYSPEEVVGRSCALLQGPDSDPIAIDEMARALASGGSTRTIVRNYRKDGTAFWNEVALTPVHADDGALTHYAAILSDVTASVDADRRAAYLATHDELTGLPNESLLKDRIEQLLSRLSRRESSVAVLMLGIQDLPAVNHALGHEAGDQLLSVVPIRIQATTRAHDTIARIGGSRFVVLCEGLTSEYGLTELAERILAAFDEPFTIGEELVRCSASIGVATTTSALPSPDTLLREADSALRRAIESDGSTFEVFNVAMRARIERRSSLTKDLRDVIRDDAMDMAFQPVVDIGSGSVRGLEALARWNHPTRGAVSPEEFIPLAEETGLILELGRTLFRQACAEFAEAGLPSAITLSINLSIRQLADRKLVSTIESAAADAGLDLGRLAVEITETALTSDLQSAAARLWELRELGIAVHLDDFGAGFASLGHLRRFPIDTIKIDRSFIGGLGSQSQDATLVSAILPMGRALGLEVVAEGVETDTQLAHLSSLGCRLAQGYLFARPNRIGDLRELIEARSLQAPQIPSASQAGTLQAAYREALLGGDLRQAIDTVRAALGSGVAPIAVQTQLIGPALRWVGAERDAGRIGSADADTAGAISERALAEILATASVPEGGARRKVLVAAIQGAHPSAGPRTTTDLFAGAGYEALHLGANITTTVLVDAIREHQPVALYLTAARSESSWGLVDLLENIKRVAPQTVLVVGGPEAAAAELETTGAHFVRSPQDALEVIDAATRGNPTG